MKRKIYVLVIYECSRVITGAMRSHGAVAFSCDVQSCGVSFVENFSSPRAAYCSIFNLSV